MTDSDPKTPRRNWTRLLLIASLAVNLAIIGAVIGGIAASKKPRLPMIDNGQGAFRALVRALPEAERTQLRDLARDKRGDMRNARRGFEANREEFFAVLAAETLDPAALDAVFDTQADLIHQVTVDGFSLLGTVLSQMPAEARAAYLEQLRNGPPPRRRGPDEGGRKPRD